MQQLSLTFAKQIILLSPDEVFDAIDEAMLVALNEDRRIERKPAGYHLKELAKYISMWANTAPEGGIIIVGMEDSKTLTGCHKLTQDRINELEKAAYNFVPDAKVQTKRVEIRAVDGSPSFVLVYRVRYREDKVVRTVSGEAFIRIGDSKIQLSDSEIRELEIDKREVDIEKEPVPLTFPDDFDMSLVRRFVDGVKRVHNLLIPQPDIGVLAFRRLGVMKNGVFIPNVACALAFASDPVSLFPGCQIKFLRVDGEFEMSGDKYNVIKTIPIEGPVPRLIEEASKIISSQLRDFSRLGNDGIFYSAPEYPADAWHEALVNACIHRSYGLKNMNVFVKMFDDKLVIESPGGFPPFVTPQNIYTVHHPRNPTLMRAMLYMGLVKEHAEGTKRMRDTMQDMRLPEPQFEQVQSGVGFAQVRVTLRNHIKQRKVWVDSDVSNVLGEALAKNLSPEEKRVLNFVAEHGKINVTQCLRIIPSLPKWHAAKRLLDKLVDKGLLVHNHSDTVLRDNRAHYVLPEAYRTVTQNAEVKKRG